MRLSLLGFFFFFVFSELSFFERLALRIFRCISIGRRGFQFKGDLLPISSVKSTIIEASKNNALKDSKKLCSLPTEGKIICHANLCTVTSANPLSSYLKPEGKRASLFI